MDEWRACAAGMTIPFDEGLGIHPQDDQFLDREVWDLSETPAGLRPLLLHYHPLVIYRFQVLKQADVVLALFLQGDRFTAAQKRADFEYYDPITTGDSTLSSVVQSIVAAEVGYHEVALDYFLRSLYVDLANKHENTVDGLHIASTGGVWSALVFGFAGMRDRGGRLSFDPRLPACWPSMRFPIAWQGSRLRVELTQAELVDHPREGGIERGPPARARRGAGPHRRLPRTGAARPPGRPGRRDARRQADHRWHSRRRHQDHRHRARADRLRGAGVRRGGVPRPATDDHAPSED